MANDNLMGVLPFVAARKPERDRIKNAVFLNLVPGSPAHRAAFSAIALTTVARESVRREKRVAGAVLSAIDAISAGDSAATAFTAQPALRDLSPDDLATRFTDSFGTPGEGTGSSVGSSGNNDVKALWTALDLATEMLIEAIGRSKGSLFTVDEAREYDDYLDLLSGAKRDEIVKPASD